ncbi:MAG: SH3 domain-containing protein, partial [Pseudolabrys sp.]
MKHAPILFGLGVLALSAMPALAKPAYVGSTVNLRAAPGTKSEVITKIPGGSLIDAGECSEGWCEVTWQEKKGFAIQTALDLSGRVPRLTTGSVRRPVYGSTVQADPNAGYVPIDEPEYYGPPAAAYYYGGGPYYRP